MSAMEIDKLKLLMGRPILIDKKNNSFIHQPIIRDIVDIGEGEFNKLILPYVISTDLVFNGVDNEDELIDKFDIFDLFFIKLDNGGTLLDNMFDGNNALNTLTESLKYFFNTDDVRVLEKRQKIVIDNSYLIDKDEFSNIRSVIQSLVCRKDIEVEKPPKNMTKRQKDIWNKLQRGRRRTAERNAIYMQDIINFASFGGRSFIPFDQIEKMTYFQLQNAYKSVMGIDAYNIGMGYKLSQKFDVKEDIKHWTDSLKIGK